MVGEVLHPSDRLQTIVARSGLAMWPFQVRILYRDGLAKRWAMGVGVTANEAERNALDNIRIRKEG